MPIPLLIPAAIGAAGAIGGALLGNRANASQAQKNRDFQERMSSTALTRARNDMMNAGINPAQIANVGGASTPGGAVAQMSPNPLEGGISNARDTARAMAEIANLKKTNALISAQEQKTKTEGATAEIQGTLLTEQARAVEQQRRFDLAMQPQRFTAQALANLISGFTVPGMQNEANLQKKLGTSGAAIPFILNSAKGAKALFR